MDEPQSARIEQAVHGYDSGHRLLQASIDLPSAARDVLAVMSDLSGTRTQPEFDSYLTGYPLPDTDLFVFARTWLAPEMSRPGCVWTHSLLIRTADLVHLTALDRLTELHARPLQSLLATDRYKESIVLDVASKVRHPFRPPIDPETAASILVGLYASGAAGPVLLAAPTASRFESLILAVWEQQWPRMRRVFRFCTGSLALRRLGSEPFDLQVVPLKLLAALSHSAREIAFVIPDTTEELVAADAHHSLDSQTGMRTSWVGAATTDLLTFDPGSPFRRWMRILAAESDRPRFDADFYLRLAAALTSRPADMTSAVELLAERFPKREQGDRIKLEVLAPPRGQGRTQLPDEVQILVALIQSREPEAFSEADLNLRARARSVWLHSCEEGLRLLEATIASGTNAFALQVLLGVCEAVPEMEAIDLARDRPGLFYHLVITHPTLLNRWGELRESPQLREEALAALRVLPADERPPVTELVRFALHAPPEVAKTLYGIYGASLVTALLDAIDHRAVSRNDLKHLFAVEWQSILIHETPILRTWLTPGVQGLPILGFLINVLSPQDFRMPGADSWASVLDGNTDELPIEAWAVLLSVALGTTSRDGGRLAGLTFPAVHSAAVGSTLSGRAWSFLQNSVPTLSYGFTWDKAELLRRAVLDAFAAPGPWRFVDFLAAFSELDSLRAACEYARKGGRTRKFLEKLATAMQSEEFMYSPDQRQIVKDALRARRGLFS
jgi:hypothetical protein